MAENALPPHGRDPVVGSHAQKRCAWALRMIPWQRTLAQNATEERLRDRRPTRPHHPRRRRSSRSCATCADAALQAGMAWLEAMQASQQIRFDPVEARVDDENTKWHKLCDRLSEAQEHSSPRALPRSSALPGGRRWRLPAEPRADRTGRRSGRLQA